jgi:hypothetical protein
VFLARRAEQGMHNLETVATVLINETWKFYLLLDSVVKMNSLFGMQTQKISSRRMWSRDILHFAN